VSDDRKCRNCGGLDEFLYEINWQPVYYCATCDVESNGSLSERVATVCRPTGYRTTAHVSPKRLSRRPVIVAIL
jgi:hypothetical protein